jgi:hypothetical protein
MQVHRQRLPLAALWIASAACVPNLADQASKAPTFDRPGEAKCGVAKSQSEPLVVEWPSAARAKLEALAKTGVVAVHYTGCEMEVLASCNAPGKYAYTAITPKRDHVAIRNEDDLYANIPLGAAKLEGKLERAGELDVDMSIVGRYASDRAVVRADELQGPDCSKATHVVSALTVGAFDFFAGSGATVSASAKTAVGGVGGSGNSQASKELLNSDGRRDSCNGATTADGKPPDGCGAILRLEVVPLGEATRQTAVGAATPPPPAPGTAPTSPTATIGVGGEVELAVPEKDMTFQATVDAGGKTFSCPQAVTYYKPCHLSGLPEGEAHVHLSGTSAFDRVIPISADGRTNVQILHRGWGQEIGTGIAAVIGGGLVAFGFLNGAGLASQDSTGADNGSFALNVTLVTVGGVVAFYGLLYFTLGSVSAHDALMVEVPGKEKEVASEPGLRWAGPLSPTTFRF